MPIGRPFEKGNHFGAGRPKGSRNKTSMLLQALLEEHSPAILLEGMELAKKGNPRMIQSFLPYILPSRRELPIETKPLPMGDALELSKSSEKLMERTTSGEISLSDSSALAALMEQRRQIIKTEDHEIRLRAVEQQARENKPDE